MAESKMEQTCSWCNEFNPVTPGVGTLCKKCGHRADMPMMRCDCVACLPTAPHNLRRTRACIRAMTGVPTSEIEKAPLPTEPEVFVLCGNPQVAERMKLGYELLAEVPMELLLDLKPNDLADLVAGWNVARKGGPNAS